MRKQLLAVGILAGVVLAGVLAGSLPAQASHYTTACDWEMGGIPETDPEPCEVPVSIGDAVTVIVSSLPEPVTITGAVDTELEDSGPEPVEVRNTPLPVQGEQVDVEPVRQEIEDGRNEVVLAGGLILFLLSVHVVRSWARRG